MERKLSNIKKEENLLVTSVEVKEECLTKLVQGEAKCPAVYGKTNIDDDEESCLNLPPSYAIYNQISNQNISEEFETGKTKIRWD